MHSLPHNEIQYFADRSYRVVRGILASFGVEDGEAEVDRDILVEIAEFFLRDIYRIDKQQRGSVSIAKWAGYWAFWIRKLKPVSMAQIPGDQHYKSISIDDAVNINERVALQFAYEIVAEYRENVGLEDLVFSHCSKAKAGECNGVDCFWRPYRKIHELRGRIFLKLHHILYEKPHVWSSPFRASHGELDIFCL